MSRDITSDVSTIIGSASVQPFMLFEGEFVSGYLRVWTGYGDLSWNGFTWQGTGYLFDLSQIKESSDNTANGVTVSFSGIPSSMISLALSDIKQNLPGKIWVGFLNNGVVSDPVLLFEGRLDVSGIQEEGDTSTINIDYESRLIDLQRPRENRYTHEEQQARFAGDLGCEFVVSLQEANVVWGRAG